MENNETNVNQGQEVETSGTETQSEKTYSQSEVDALLQSEVDRRITSALKKQERKNQEAIQEAKKLASMNEADRFKYELEQREKAIAEKERQLALAENKAEASKILSEKGISAALVDFVVAETADEMNEKIKILDKEFKKSVKAEVEKRLAGSTPKKGLAPDKAITKEDFLKMSYSDLLELKTNNPELFNELSK